MVYREQAHDIEREERSDDPDQTLLAYDASGRPGHHGLHGADGASGSFSGSDGDTGQSAGRPTPGVHAGVIEVTFARGSYDGSVAIDGVRKDHQGRGARIGGELDHGDIGYIDLLARGGRGGDGGNGGRGGDGARGRSGSDATRYSSGSDGGPGGDGGDGGHASSGARGGDGGHILVHVAPDDTHLLMLLRQGIEGGAGGQRGVNGDGGTGGSGGSGGSSYSWTETESYTDSQGNRKTRTKYHRNAGGSNGPSGHNGSPGRARVTDGDRGKAGSFAIVVEGQRYPSRYDLRLTHFAHHSANADGVYEPLEKVRVIDVEVQNVGGMPTPASSDIELRLQQLGWVIPERGRLVLPKSLASGAKHRFTEALELTIGDYRPHSPDDPLACPEQVRHQAMLPDVRRGFRRYESDASRKLGHFVISFPTQASAIESLPALAPGEAACLRWTIRNTSKVAFGKAADNQRRVCFRLNAHESELGDDHAVLLDAGGERVPLDDGWGVEIDRIDPGQALTFEATVGFLKTAPHYRNLRLWLSLELGFIDRPHELRPVQYRDFDTRVAQRFEHCDGAQLLLVVNHRTTHQQLAAWREICDGLGIVVDVWDLSLQGGLDLSHPVEGSTLGQLFEGHTIVLLNNEVSTPEGEHVAHRCIAKQQLLEAAAEGVNLAFIGRDVGVRQLMLPTAGGAEADGQQRDASDLTKAIAGRDDDALAVTAERCAVYDWSFFGGGCDTRKLHKAALRLSAHLSARHPQQRFLVAYHLAPEVVTRKLWLKRYRVGHLEVRSLLPTASGRLLSAEVDDDRLHDPAYIRSGDNMMTLLLTRSFDDKLERLMDELKQPRLDSAGEAWMVRMLCDALLVDLCAEQATILEARWRSGMSRQRMVGALPLLRKLAASEPHTRIEPETPEGRAVITMVARLRHWAWSKWRLWEWLPPFVVLRRAPMLWWLVRSRSHAWLRSLFVGDTVDPIGKSNMKQGRKMLKSEARQIHKQWRASRKTWTLLDDTPDAEQSFAEKLVTEPLRRRGITSDVEVLDEWSARLIDMDELREYEARDQQRAKTAASVGEATAQAARELKRLRTTEQLLGG